MMEVTRVINKRLTQKENMNKRYKQKRILAAGSQGFERRFMYGDFSALLCVCLVCISLLWKANGKADRKAKRKSKQENQQES